MHDHFSISDEFLCALASHVGEDNVLMTEPMRAYTTFQIGGPADVMVKPRSVEELVRVLNVCSFAEVPVTVVGNGSNMLVGDRGVRGAVIMLGENMRAIQVDGTHVTAEAGALLRDVALAAEAAGLTGLEPLWGIPASVGGACFMNAGAYGACTADVLESVQVYIPGEPGERGSVRTVEAHELKMGYRSSRISAEGWIVLSATFALAPGNAAQIRAEMDDYRARREEKQPLDMPSAGSTFKRPEGHFAGKLIMDAGLAGERVGGAQVSEKHCGFVVNAGGATAADVCALIEHVQDTVRERFGVELEPEVRRVGEFS